MLDKTIPYKNIIMKADRKALLGTSEPRLPEGFCLRSFRPGDEYRWAELERSVGEFDSSEEALSCFCSTYLPQLPLLKERCWFVENADGGLVATATGWYDRDGDGERAASLHWVAVEPEWQGQGLGRAVTVQALLTMARGESGPFVWLHTQTWSHKAVSLYLSLGFWPVKEGSFAHYSNDYPACLPILEKTMRPAVFRRFTDTAR